MKHLINAVLIERGVDQMKTFFLTLSVIPNNRTNLEYQCPQKSDYILSSFDKK